MLKFEWWHGVDGGLFQGIDGTGVFLGVGETAVSEDAGNGLDVSSVAEEVGAFRLAYERQKSVVERDDNSTGCTMRLGFALFKLQKFV